MTRTRVGGVLVLIMTVLLAAYWPTDDPLNVPMFGVRDLMVLAGVFFGTAMAFWRTQE